MMGLLVYGGMVCEQRGRLIILKQRAAVLDAGSLFIGEASDTGAECGMKVVSASRKDVVGPICGSASFSN